MVVPADARMIRYPPDQNMVCTLLSAYEAANIRAATLQSKALAYLCSRKRMSFGFLKSPNKGA